jgi:predicted DCC family thiol-disulfide oxidoreductase YuxK
MGCGDGLHRGGPMGPGQGLTRLFYDGTCGLCRSAVHFVVRRERSGLIHFAPLGGETFTLLIPPDRRAVLPDSLVVLTPEGGLLCRTAAVAHLLRQMGPAWRRVGVLLAWLPVRPCDWVYDWVARRRPARRACPRDDAAGDERFES